MNTSKKDTLKKILNLALELNYIAEVEMSNDSWQTEEDEEISEEIGKLYDAIVSAIACASCECHLGLYINEKRDLVCMCDRNMAE